MFAYWSFTNLAVAQHILDGWHALKTIAISFGDIILVLLCAAIDFMIVVLTIGILYHIVIELGPDICRLVKKLTYKKR